MIIIIILIKAHLSILLVTKGINFMEIPIHAKLLCIENHIQSN